jgi:hypothetical protein
MMDHGDNRPLSEQYRLAGEAWVDAESAASILEDTKSSVLAQRAQLYGDIAVSKSEMLVRASADWMDHLEKINGARTNANRLKIQLEYIKMKFWEQESFNANARAERRM